MLEKKRKPPLPSWSYVPLLDDQKRRAATPAAHTHTLTPISIVPLVRITPLPPTLVFAKRPNNTERDDATYGGV